MDWATNPVQPDEFGPDNHIAFTTRFSVLKEAFSQPQWMVPLIFSAAALNVLPDYLSLLETRWILRRMQARHQILRFLILDVILTSAIASSALYVVWNVSVAFFGPSIVEYRVVGSASTGYGVVKTVTFPALLVRRVFWLYPAFFTSIWLWLYAGSGFLLKAARRLDIGFDWFNRKFDIERKPLQSIGLVAGVLVAVVYWAAVIVSRVVG